MLAVKYSGLITNYVGQSSSKVVSANSKKSNYYTATYKTQAQRENATAQFGTEISEEGITLLQNDDETLPLKSTSKISIFGQDYVDPVYGGTGAGSIDTSKAISLQDAFEDSGFTVNPTLTKFYTDGAGKDYRKSTLSVYGTGSLAVNEVPVSKYTSAVKKSFAKYNDAAVVVLGRSGSESSDLPTSSLSAGVTYLQIDPTEKAMLKMVSENFDKVIVLLNTANPMELGDLSDYNVDSVVWIGTLGQTGAAAVPEVLNGTVNPSGHTSDTYAYDSLSAPSTSNTGDYTITNSNVTSGNKYIAYSEGIYVGYRYYETRYEDSVLGTSHTGDYKYSEQVEYPFGYGLSYTTFTWSDFKKSYNKDKDQYDISLTVTNTGKVAGKNVVQIYLQSPYTDYDKQNSIEKSSVELVGYAKTKELQPNASQTVTVHVDKEDMKVYDSKGYGTLHHG